jgi:hypothetical protein
MKLFPKTKISDENLVDAIDDAAELVGYANVTVRKLVSLKLIPFLSDVTNARVAKIIEELSCDEALKEIVRSYGSIKIGQIRSLTGLSCPKIFKRCKNLGMTIKDNCGRISDVVISLPKS